MQPVRRRLDAVSRSSTDRPHAKDPVPHRYRVLCVFERRTYLSASPLHPDELSDQVHTTCDHERESDRRHDGLCVDDPPPVDLTGQRRLTLREHAPSRREHESEPT